MNVLLYRYGSICEPDVMDAFAAIGLNVIQETTEITRKGLKNSDRVALVEKGIREHHPLFVFSINFYPALAEVCHVLQTMYFCWTVDSPVPELFSKSMQHPTNRIFLFDRAQYTRFSPYCPSGTFHLPLASATQRFDQVISTITENDRATFAKDIAFVGSLYNEKSPLSRLRKSHTATSTASSAAISRKLSPKTDIFHSTSALPAKAESACGLSEYTQGYLNALEESTLKIYGCNFIEQSLTEKIVSEIKKLDGHFYDPGPVIAPCDAYIAAHSYVGMEVAVLERERTLNTLAQYFPVDLYTRSDSSALHRPDQTQSGQSYAGSENTGRLPGVYVHGGVASLTEMPKIFHLSKINLNMTVRPIQEGLPLRIFDILGCGGFCMTNYQPELTDYFEIGVDLEAYSSMEELVDKCAYYLEHEDERRQIAANGYQKVCESHTWTHRVKEMIALATQ